MPEVPLPTTEPASRSDSADELVVSRQLYLALAAITAAAMLLEVTLTRLISVALWYPFAFVALSTAMLGFGGAAVAVTISHRLRAIRPQKLLSLAAIGFATSTLLGYPLWNLLPVAPMSLGQDSLQLLWTPLMLLIITLPFIFAGLFVSRLFAALPAAAPRLYAADLLGAAAGVVLYVLIIPIVGGPGVLAVVAAIGFAAALFVDPGELPRRAALAIACVTALGLSAQLERALPLRITPNKLLGSPVAEGHKRSISWNLSSAIDVIGNKQGALIIIDGGTAMTLAPRARRRSGQSHPTPTGLRAVPYAIAPGGSTLIIGSGGGVEVQAALGAGAERVVAVEIDGAINDLVLGRLNGMLGGLFVEEGVQLVTAEARSFLAALAPEERFDVIVGFHTISNAASSTGAMSLAENYLLTVEAMQLLLGRLSDDGVLLMSRPEQQIARLAATVAAAWPEASEPGEHVLVVSEHRQVPAFMTALVVSRKPFDAETLARVRQTISGRVLYAPDGGGDRQAWIDGALGWGDPQAQRRAAEAGSSLPFAATLLEPATDDRPFFNLQRPWRDLRWADISGVFSFGSQGRARLEDASIAQVAILILLAQVIGLGIVFVLPAARGLRGAGVSKGLPLQIGMTFASFGFGFMLVEVVLIQTVTRIVGEPAWSMVAVLGVLLAATGLGSTLFAGRWQWSPSRACAGAATAALFVAVALTPLADLAAPLPFAARLVVAVILVAPVGLMLGVPFSSVMQRIQRPDLVAWAWATNSLLSVAGSIAALVLGSALGFSLTATLAAATYGVAAAFARRL